MSGSQKIGNYVVSDVKNGIIINDVNGDWQVKFSSNTQYYLAVKHYLKNNSHEELEVVFNVMFYATSTCITDMKLTEVVLNYFNETMSSEKVSSDENEKDLEIVKENQNNKENERKNGHDDK